MGMFLRIKFSQIRHLKIKCSNKVFKDVSDKSICLQIKFYQINSNFVTLYFF